MVIGHHHCCPTCKQGPLQRMLACFISESRQTHGSLFSSLCKGVFAAGVWHASTAHLLELELPRSVSSNVLSVRRLCLNRRSRCTGT